MSVKPFTSGEVRDLERLVAVTGAERRWPTILRLLATVVVLQEEIERVKTRDAACIAGYMRENARLQVETARLRAAFESVQVRRPKEETDG